MTLRQPAVEDRLAEARSSCRCVRPSRNTIGSADSTTSRCCVVLVHPGDEGEAEAERATGRPQQGGDLLIGLGPASAHGASPPGGPWTAVVPHALPRHHRHAGRAVQGFRPVTCGGRVGVRRSAVRVMIPPPADAVTRRLTRPARLLAGAAASGGHRQGTKGTPRCRAPTTTPDFEAIKKNQRAGWETGDYPRVGNTLQIIAELLVEAADVRAGQRVLDVACGQGNAAHGGGPPVRRGDRRRLRRATCWSRDASGPRPSTCDVTFLEGDAEDAARAGRLVRPDAEHRRRDVRAGPPAGRRRARPGHRARRQDRAGELDPERHDRRSCSGPSAAGRRRRPGCGRRRCGAPRAPGRAVRRPGRVDRARRSGTYTFRYHSPEHFSEWFRDFYGPITRLAGTLAGDDLEQFAADLADVRAPVQPRRRRHAWRRRPSTWKRSASGAA